MSVKFLITAALAIGLSTSSVAWAAMPGSVGQPAGGTRVEASFDGVQPISMRRHHNGNQFRVFVGQRRTCSNDRDMWRSDRCMWMHLHNSHPEFFFNSGERLRHRHFQPNFGFSIGF
jgi:hypothetical protein